MKTSVVSVAEDIIRKVHYCKWQKTKKIFETNLPSVFQQSSPLELFYPVVWFSALTLLVR